MRRNPKYGRYFERKQAVLSIANKIGIAFKAACDAMAGKVWSGVQEYWVDRVIP